MRVLTTILFCLFYLIALTQEFEVSVDRNPALTTEIIQLQFSINDKGDDFVPPALSNFHILSGPNNSFQQSYSNVNGKLTKEIKTTITYRIQGKEAGTFMIPSTYIKVNGKKIHSKSLKITIEKDNSQPINTKRNNDIFVKQSTNKSQIYVGEQIYSISKIYIKEGVSVQNSSIKPITYNGFWEEEVEINTNKRDREIINGIPFTVIKFRHSVLTAQTSGKLSIPSSEIEVSIARKGKLIGYDFFNRPQYEKILSTQSLLTREKKITVKNLPSTTTENFYGTVSEKFHISSEVDRTNLKTNEAISFQLSFRGNGNINMLEPFEIEFPESFEVFEPNVTNKTFIGNSTTGGSKTFEYILIPREDGDFIVSPVTFNYFNPRTQQYIKIMSDEHAISVEKGKQYIPRDTNNYSSESLKILTETKFTKIKNRNRLFNRFRVSFWSILVLIILIYLIKIYLKNRKIDAIARKRKKATKIAIKRLRNASICIKNKDFEKFFEEIEKSLWGYFADKFNVNKSKLSKETVESYFNKNNISKENRLDFISLINECEFARFSPSKNKNQKMESTLNKAKEIIVNVESSNKK